MVMTVVMVVGVGVMVVVHSQGGDSWHHRCSWWSWS